MTHARLTQEELSSLQAFWNAYEPHAEETAADVLEAAKKLHEFAPALATMNTVENRAREQRSRHLQRLALLDGQWDEYLTDLREQGAGYARMGIPFSGWFQLVSEFRKAVRERIIGAAPGQEFRPALDGMNLYLDIAMATIGDAYLAAKEQLIAQQQQAIRELSTPVLQVRDRLLIIPVVGLVDTRRARHLTETMLQAIRDRRARAIVMDITGVPIVDSKVANHLAQACEAARLMGARVLMTGLSPEIAQALVALGAELRGVSTLGDLESGIEEAERMLGYRVARAPEEAGALAPGGSA